MQILKTENIKIINKNSVNDIRNIVRKYADELGMNIVTKTKLCAAANELALNSLKYSVNPFVIIELVKSERENENLEGVSLIFKDDGPGIKDINKILANSEDSDTHEIKQIGLVTAKRLVDSFSINSEVNKFTEIKIVCWNKPLKIKINGFPEKSEDDYKKIVINAFEIEVIKNIYVIDDEEYICNSLARNLKLLNYKVKTFLSSESAWDYIETHKENIPDLIISDYKLKGQTGIEFLTKIKEKYPDISLILMTGYGDRKLVLESLRIGVDEFLDKPFNDEDISKAIANVEEKRHRRNKINSEKYKLLLNELNLKLKKIEKLESELHTAKNELKNKCLSISI